MSTWNKNGEKFLNTSDVIRPFLDKIEQDQVNHYGPIFLGDPRSEDFLREISVITHIWGVGDRLSKIAYEHYGDAKLWWLLAWFNAKPTDFHCKVGDIIQIPVERQEAIDQATQEGSN